MASHDIDRSIEILTFGLEDEIFAVEATCVREILDLAHVTEVPGAQPFVNGLLNVRGKVVPLADLRVKFDMEQRPPTIDSRIVVLEIEIDGEPVTVGIRADKVFEVTELPATALEAAPKIGMRWRPEHIRFVGKRAADVIIVLDIERVFSSIENQEPVAHGHHAHSQAALTLVPVAQQGA
jgi:purine-binding chemotaxis protein CheW